MAEAGALQEALALLGAARSALRGAVGLGAVTAVVSLAPRLPGPRRGGPAFSGRCLYLFDKELSPDTGPARTTILIRTGIQASGNYKVLIIVLILFE